MKNVERISGRQFALLAMYITIGDTALVLPSIPAMAAGRDAWISTLLGLALGMGIVLLYNAVGSQNGGMAFVEYAEKLLGRWGGGLLACAFLFYILVSSATLVREVGDFMTTQMMPETPIHAIHIFYVGVVLMAAYLGLESIARTGEFFFPFLILFFIVFVSFLLPSIEWNNVQPLMEKGIGPVLHGSISTTAYPFAELVVMLMIIPQVNNRLAVRSSFVKGALLGGLLIGLIIFMSIAILGHDFAARNMYPSYALAKKIDIGQFLQRIEVILAFMWLLTGFIKTSIYWYVFHITFAQIFRLRQYRSMVLPSGLLLVTFAILISPNINHFQQMNDFWPYMDFILGIGSSLLLLAAGFIRGRSRRSRGRGN
jgi:spore germination protein KB